MRDLIGFTCLVVAAVSLALLIALFTSARTAAWLTGLTGYTSTRRRPAMLLVIAAVGLGAGGLALLALPHYEGDMHARGQLVAAPGSAFVATLRNHGWVAGGLAIAYSLDGKRMPAATARVAPGATVAVPLPLPDDLSAGKHILQIGDRPTTFVALRPAAYHVGGLQAVPTIAKVGESVSIGGTVENTGEADGAFPGELAANGRTVSTRPLPLAGGAVETLDYQFTQKHPGTYRLKVGDGTVRVTVVKPVRPPSGTVLVRHTGGNGVIRFTNQKKDDCLVLLAPSTRAKHPDLAFYVRARTSCKVTDIGDSVQFVYYTYGKDWNRTTKDFITANEHARFTKPAAFTTSKWTSSSIDWAARIKWTTYHTQYTVCPIRINDKFTWSPLGQSVWVDEGKFPTL